MAILTLSREFASCGDSIGKMAAESLGYHLVQKENLLIEASKFGDNWRTWSRELDERCPTLWERYDWSFRGFGALLRSVILQFALQNNKVIIGRGGNFVLQDVPHALTVRIVSSVEARIERIMERELLSRNAAKRLDEKKNHERECFIKALYGKDWNDPAWYELCFDTSKQSADHIVQCLSSILKDREKSNTEEARSSLAMLAKAAHVKAGILTNPSIFIPIFDVVPEGKRLVVKGVIHNDKELEYLTKAASELAGQTPLDYQLHYRV